MLFIYLCVNECFVCVVYWVREGVCVCACMHEGQGFSSDLSLYISPIYFWGQVSHWTYSSLFLLDYLTTKLQRSAYLYPPPALESQTCATSQQCCTDAGNLKSLGLSDRCFTDCCLPNPHFYMSLWLILFSSWLNLLEEPSILCLKQVCPLSVSSHPLKHIRLTALWATFLIFRRNSGADAEATYEETVKGSALHQTPISYFLLLQRHRDHGRRWRDGETVGVRGCWKQGHSVSWANRTVTHINSWLFRQHTQDPPFSFWEESQFSLRMLLLVNAIHPRIYGLYKLDLLGFRENQLGYNQFCWSERIKLGRAESECDQNTSHKTHKEQQKWGCIIINKQKWQKERETKPNTSILFSSSYRCNVAS